MINNHRLVDEMICCCGWEDSPQAFRWSGELPAVGHSLPRDDQPRAAGLRVACTAMNTATPNTR